LLSVFVGLARPVTPVALCWAITHHSGTRLYVIYTGTTSVAVYDLTQDALNPNLIQHFQMVVTSGNPFSAVIDDSVRTAR